jgi:HSP20 family molecular chaperone IbpA
MSESQELTNTPKTEAVKSTEHEIVLQPPVDICEDSDGISLLADMPGVSKDRLDIQVDKDTLVIDGVAKLNMAEGMKPLYADVRSTRYRRSFAISSELDTDNIEASLKDGVLNLRLHKRPESKPRKIEVSVG